MAPKRPKPISSAALAKRENRVEAIARGMGFVGRIEYRHLYSQTGGASYGLARAAKDDLLTIYAEAFDRDADTDDFSLEAIIAHERGHQLIERHSLIRKHLPKPWSEGSDETVASILGSLVVVDDVDREILISKAVVEIHKRGLEFEKASVLVYKLRAILGECL